MQPRVARIFNTYGPDMQPNDGRVISNFIIQTLLEIECFRALKAAGLAEPDPA